MIDFHVHIDTGDYDLDELMPHPYNELIKPRYYGIIPKLDNLIPDELSQRISWLGGVYVKNQALFGITKSVHHIILRSILRTLKTSPLEKLIKIMDATGIEKSVVQVIEPYMNTDDAIGFKEKTGRLYVFGSVNFSADNYCEEAEKFKEKNVDGFKMHPPLQLFSAGSHKMFEVTESLPENLPILIDAGPFLGSKAGTDVNELYSLLKRYKTRRFVLAHIGKGQYEDTLRLACKYDNVALETSLQPAKVIRKAINTVGAERILMGSDFPILTQKKAINELKKATNSREFELISKINALNFLKK